SVILGQAVLGSRNIVMASFGALLGSVLYRLIIFLALRAGLDTNDMKLTTALLVVAALLLPRWGLLKRIPSLRGRGNRAASAVPQGTTDMKDPAEIADVPTGTAGAAAAKEGRGPCSRPTTSPRPSSPARSTSARLCRICRWSSRSPISSPSSDPTAPASRPCSTRSPVDFPSTPGRSGSTAPRCP